jgi:phytoene dehydrogenase-like protein
MIIGSGFSGLSATGYLSAAGMRCKKFNLCRLTLGSRASSFPLAYFRKDCCPAII